MPLEELFGMNRRLQFCLQIAFFVAFAAVSPAFGEWEAVAREIQSRIQRLEPPLQASKIGIEYRNNGSVILTGRVESAADRRRVEATALGAHGVAEVDNRLEIASVTDLGERAVGGEVSTSPLAQRVMASVHEQLSNVWYQIGVQDSGDTLEVTGMVDTEGTREQILEIARRASAKNVLDHLVLRPLPDDSELKTMISQVIERDFPLLAPKILVAVDKGNVLLTGDLKDHWDIDGVLANVVMVDGVRNVDSKITINGAPYHSEGAISSRK